MHVLPDLNELAVFVKVVEIGSFVGAARALGMPKSTVSRKLAEMEQRLGVRLLHRTTRTVRPTDAGQAHYARVARLLSDALEAEAALREATSTPRGLLRLSVPSLLGQVFLGPVFSAAHARYPDLAIEVVVSDRRVDLIEEGYDLAIRVGALDDSSLVARRLGGIAHHVYGSPTYLDQRGVPTTPDDLAHHECIVFTSPPVPGWRFRAPTGGDRRISVVGRLSVNDLLVARQAAIAGIGLAWLPAFICREDVASARLRRVLTDWSPPPIALHALHPGGRQPSTKVRAFLDILNEMLVPDPEMGNARPASGA